jgi:hypothetical protein
MLLERSLVNSVPSSQSSSTDCLSYNLKTYSDEIFLKKMYLQFIPVDDLLEFTVLNSYSFNFLIHLNLNTTNRLKDIINVFSEEK